MDIFVNGSPLDIYEGQDVETNFTNIRFGDAIQDEWSTDIDIPRNANNVRLLKLATLLDGVDVLNSRIPCTLSLGYRKNITDGYIVPLSVTDDTITISVFISVIPTEFLDKKIRDILGPDTSSTILNWGQFSSNNNTRTYVHDYNKGMEMLAGRNKSNPCIDVDELLKRIENASGYSMPVLSCQDLRCLMNRTKVAPESTQTIKVGFVGKGYYNETNQCSIVGGSHPVNDLDVHDHIVYGKYKYTASSGDIQNTGWHWKEQDISKSSVKFDVEPTKEIKFNKGCSASFSILTAYYGNAPGIGPDTLELNVIKNGTETLGSFLIYPQPSTNEPYLFELNNITFEKDDTLSFEERYLGGTVDIEVSALIRISYSYEKTDDDYDMDLNYIPILPEIGGGYSYLYTQNHGFYNINGWGYSMFGCYCNMPDITIRELLTSLCWYTGKRLRLSGTMIEMVNATETKTIDAIIEEYIPSSDTIGQRSTIGYKDDTTPVAVDIHNDFISAEKKIFESAFIHTPKDKKGRLVVNQYEYETGETVNEVIDARGMTATELYNITRSLAKVKMNEIGPVLGQSVYDSRTQTWHLAPAGKFNDMGFDMVCTAMEIKAWTYDDITDTDFVFIDGHKFMVIDGNRNVDTGRTTFRALAVYDYQTPQMNETFEVVWTTIGSNNFSVEVEVPTPSAIETLKLHVSQIGDFSDDRVFNLMVDSQQATKNIYKGTATALSPYTTYYYKVSAHGDQLLIENDVLSLRTEDVLASVTVDAVLVSPISKTAVITVNVTSNSPYNISLFYGEYSPGPHAAYNIQAGVFSECTFEFPKYNTVYDIHAMVTNAKGPVLSNQEIITTGNIFFVDDTNIVPSYPGSRKITFTPSIIVPKDETPTVIMEFKKDSEDGSIVYRNTITDGVLETITLPEYDCSYYYTCKMTIGLDEYETAPKRVDVLAKTVCSPINRDTIFVETTPFISSRTPSLVQILVRVVSDDPFEPVTCIDYNQNRYNMFFAQTPHGILFRTNDLAYREGMRVMFEVKTIKGEYNSGWFDIDDFI